MPSQFIRAVTLLVEGASDALNLSEFRIVFEVSQSDYQTLNTMKATVYNLSDDTAQKIQKEYTKVTLQAGYQNGNIAVLFQGSIKQVKRGREDQTNTYIDIFAADGDVWYTNGAVNKTLAAGWQQEDVVKALASDDVSIGDVKFASVLNPLPRGKVMYGMNRIIMRKTMASSLSAWSIQGGKLTVSPITGYTDNEAVVINSATGMIGLPEQTEDGLKVTCLLNPKIVIGTQIHIDQKSIQTGSIPNDPGFLSLPKDQLDLTNFYPPTSSDGFYKVFVAEHRGDTRGNDYYTDLVLLSIDKTQPVDKAVKAAG